MSDLLIREFDVPKPGKYAAALQIYEDGAAVLEVTWTRPFERPRSTSCLPITILPKGHGRLVDADALQAKFELMENALAEHGRPYSFSFKDGGEMCAEWWTVQDALEREPTIIGAEGGADDG